ncbi:hypothetical protein ANANG_G00060600 [Anguilla anguilla]|uniref:Uncharacterized protein n=1 Tax=Anguilla anguilla TaxID=7936 RepID=A0A9D3S2J0_ANGAN|nr:hypothetical protein ANANG_G00060600 [Anguilla anguilla]
MGSLGLPLTFHNLRAPQPASAVPQQPVRSHPARPRLTRKLVPRDRFCGTGVASLGCQQQRDSRPHSDLRSSSPLRGWEGDLCDEVVDHCAEGFDPCQHDAKCVPLSKGYRCECLPGYVGQHCEQDYDDCLENKCQHGAQCVDAVNGYTCVCKEGFSGLFCESPPPMILLQTSPCDHADCQNGSQEAYVTLPGAKTRPTAHISLQVATDKDNGVLLYKDDNDPIVLELYQGHIRLIYDIANYPTTFYSVETVNDGLFHTVEVLIQNHTLSLVVDKGAPRSLGKLPRQPSMDQSTQVYIGGVPSTVGIVCAQGACRQRGDTGVSCECPPGRSGPLCDQKSPPSPCQASRCVHGLCVPKGSGYSCQCAEGFSGQYCDRPEEPPACRGHYCGHGECWVTESGAPACRCQPGYAGPNCDTEPTCQGEVVREQLKRHQGHKTCTSTGKVARAECSRACEGGLCCAPVKTRRRKVVFKCTDGSSFSEELETSVECGCTKCPL